MRPGIFPGHDRQKHGQDELLRDLLSLEAEDAQRFNEQLFEQKRLSVTGMSVVTDMDQGLAAVLDGHALLFVDGDPRMIDIPCSSIEKRAIEEAPNESVIQAARILYRRPGRQYQAAPETPKNPVL